MYQKDTGIPTEDEHREGAAVLSKEETCTPLLRMFEDLFLVRLQQTVIAGFLKEWLPQHLSELRQPGGLLDG